jgi:hypothetical protein
MKLSWRRPRLLLSAVMAVGALAGLTVAAAPAYAAGPYVTASGGPGEVEVYVAGRWTAATRKDARGTCCVNQAALGPQVVLTRPPSMSNWRG